MQQHLAPKMLLVNGKPSPCHCFDDGETKVVCVYCTQANLIAWEKQEHPEQDIEGNVLEKIKKIGVRRVARNLGIHHTTVMKWSKYKKINKKYFEATKKVVTTLG